MSDQQGTLSESAKKCTQSLLFYSYIIFNAWISSSCIVVESGVWRAEPLVELLLLGPGVGELSWKLNVIKNAILQPFVHIIN